MGEAAALALSAGTHWSADRRIHLKALANATGNGNFYQLGAPLGGSYALDLLCTTNFASATGEHSKSEVRSDPERFEELGHVVAIPVAGLVHSESKYASARTAARSLAARTSALHGWRTVSRPISAGAGGQLQDRMVTSQPCASSLR